MSRWMFQALTGYQTLEKQLSDNDKNNSDLRQAQNRQNAFLRKVEQDWINDDWNLKTLIKSIVLSPYWRAAALDTPNNLDSYTRLIEGERLLSPEMIYRKVKAVLGVEWNNFKLHHKDARLQNLPMIILYGGIDSHSVINRSQTANGMMSAIQERYASDIACAATVQDFSLKAKDRHLFANIDSDIEPTARNKQQLLGVLQQLHFKLHGDDLALNDAQLQRSYELLSAVWQQGQGSNKHTLPKACRTKTITKDPNYMITSWMAVLTYLISDYGFAFE